MKKLIIGGLLLMLFALPLKAEAKTITSKKLTHYGYNCKGCSGITASGWNIKKKGIYYTDSKYGKVRICATSKKFPLFSILEIPKYKKGSIKCIVLDRGVSGTKIDLLTTSEKKASKLGIQRKVKVNVLRVGK